MIVPPSQKVKRFESFLASFLDHSKTDLSYEDVYDGSELDTSVKIEPVYVGTGDSIYMGDYVSKTFVSNEDYDEAVENSEKFFTDKHDLMTGLDENDRIKIRVQMCGHFHCMAVAWQNGVDRKSNPYYCNCYLLCPECLKRRAEKLKEEVLKVAVAACGNLRVITLDSSKATELRRAIGKDNFKCIPQESGKDLVIYNTEDQNVLNAFPGNLVDSDFFQNTDWQQVARTPKGRKMSGSITKSFSKVAPPQQSETEKKDKILGMNVYLLPDRDKEEQAWKQTLVKTINLDPQSPLELQQALLKRTNLFVNEFRDLGGIVRSTKIVNIYVTMSQVDWHSPLKELDLPASP